MIKLQYQTNDYPITSFSKKTIGSKDIHSNIGKYLQFTKINKLYISIGQYGVIVMFTDNLQLFNKYLQKYIEDLKEDIEQITSIPDHAQRLIHNGRQLENRKLQYYNIKNDSKIHLLIRMHSNYSFDEIPSIEDMNNGIVSKNDSDSDSDDYKCDNNTCVNTECNDKVCEIKMSKITPDVIDREKTMVENFTNTSPNMTTQQLQSVQNMLVNFPFHSEKNRQRAFKIIQNELNNRNNDELDIPSTRV